MGGREQPGDPQKHKLSADDKETFVVNVMQELQKRRMVMETVNWLRANYQVGTSGFTSKRDVFNHFMRVCKKKEVEPKISHTFFGKIVKKAFPNIKYNRKGPRGATQQCYTFLQRMTTEEDQASSEINLSCLEEDEHMATRSKSLLARIERGQNNPSSLQLYGTNPSMGPTETYTLPSQPASGNHSLAHTNPAFRCTFSLSSSSFLPSTSSSVFNQLSSSQGPTLPSLPVSSGAPYFFFSLPQVATPCTCSSCTNVFPQNPLSPISALPSIPPLVGHASAAATVSAASDHHHSFQRIERA